jgi:hypothetical protein
MNRKGNSQSRSALVVAHPSHELCVHGWLQASRPAVFVLTDGSGRSAESRLRSTTKVLTDVGAKPGSIYGRVRDIDVYEAFLNRDFSFFIRLAEELAEEFTRQRIEYVVGDSDEGYSPTHDVCRLLTNAALEMIRRRSGRQVANFDFAVVGAPDDCPPQIRNKAVWIHLDDDAFSRKVAAARAYNAKLALDVEAALRGELFKGVRRLSGPHLAGEVDNELSKQVVAALHGYPEVEKRIKGVFDGIELSRFRTECLRPVIAYAKKQPEPGGIPFYELYGEKMVAAGNYQKTIRHAEHFLPLAEAVWRHVGTY